jgi:ATP phosphoribosyltransferase regulatory subunit
LPADRIEAVQRELDGKDAGALPALGAEAYLPLLEAAGPLDQALARLEALPCRDALAGRLAGIRRLGELIGERARITLDPTERHGFEYQTWIGFSLFADGVRGEVGRGGSYVVCHADGREEAAVGFSLYLDPLIEATVAEAPLRRIFLPLGTPPATGAELRAQGWTTVAALGPSDDARAQRCTHRLDGTAPVAL